MAGDCAVRVSDTRRGERTVVLLHGYLESLDVWDGFTELLAPAVRVVAVDLPGHGVSEVKGAVHTMEFMADTVRAALRTLGVERAVAVGHSMGGYVALELLRKYSDALDGLVLFHSSPDADSERKREDRLREIALIEGGKKELIARTFPYVGFAPQNRERLAWAIGELAEQIAMTEDAGIVAVLRGIRERRDLNDAMRGSSVPQLLVFGRHDGYVTPEAAAEIIRRQPQARVRWLENSGHMGFVEEPERAAGLLKDFLEEVYGGAVGSA